MSALEERIVDQGMLLTGTPPGRVISRLRFVDWYGLE
jgi:hypothetical protein